MCSDTLLAVASSAPLRPPYTSLIFSRYSSGDDAMDEIVFDDLDSSTPILRMFRC